MDKPLRDGSNAYTPEAAHEICQRLAEGETLRAICRDEHLPARSTVHLWVVYDIQGFADQYARAREIGCDEIADETIEIADDGSNDWMEDNDPDNPGYRQNGEHIQRSRVRIDTRKWYLGKMSKRYRDKPEENTDSTTEIILRDAPD